MTNSSFGYYKNWRFSKAALWKYTFWYEVGSLLNCLTSTIATDFGLYDCDLDEMSVSLLKRVAASRCPPPYDRYVRFPKHVQYVTEGSPFWSEKFESMRLALQFHPPNIFAFHQTRENIIGDILEFDLVFTRSIFEELAGVEWVIV